jgi:subtilisin family serine protease
MVRRIVVIRSGAVLDAVRVAGLRFDDTYHPVRISVRLGVPKDRPQASGFDYRSPGPTSYCVRGECDDEDVIARLLRDRRADVVGVYADPEIAAFPEPYCGPDAVGSDADVADRLGVPALRAAGLTGREVRVAIVDTGIDGRQIPVSGGWSPNRDYRPGSAPPTHGTMVAYDVRIAAPDARILDYALLQSRAETWTALLSDAIAAYADLLQVLERDAGPLVVNNSWGIYDRAQDAPIGSPENYSANPHHPFNQVVGSIVAAGADVFFAAGNCGADCPSRQCGTKDVGPGASIHGANSHPDVVTVAAVTVTDRRLGYSSQGPGGLTRRKPDLAAFSHFRGSGVYPVDTGTSAASPVAAGAAAALRQRVSTTRLKPAQVKGLLQRTARDLEGNGWDFDLGYGVLDAAAALLAIGTP